MPLQYPGRSTPARCGQGSKRGFRAAIGQSSSGFDRWPSFTSTKCFTQFGVAGVTKDSSGAALAGCTVDLYSESRVWLAQTVSDGSGNYAFTGVGVGSVFIVAYLAGAPDVAGTTIRNVQPVTV